MADFSWIPFYKELSYKLLQYREKRKDLIDIVLKAYSNSRINMPRLDSTETPSDIDPFTVFGMFNKTMKDANRMAFCSALKNLITISSEVPSGFDGIPVLNPLNVTFYCFVGDPNRGDHDIDKLWECFAAAVRYADTPNADTEKSFISSYDAVKDLKGNRWKLSMALFWIRPYSYLNLDSRNQWFLKERSNLGETFTTKLKALKDIPDGKTYVELCKDCIRCIRAGSKYASIAELSHDAWNVSEAVNRGIEEVKQPDAGTVTVDVDTDVRQTHYWLYAPGHNAEQWDKFYKEGIMAIGWGETGDVRNYASREEIKEKLRNEWASPDSPALFPSLALWQFLHEMKPGDIVFVKQGRKKIIGRGVVRSDYTFVEDYPVEDYCHQREVQWTHSGHWDYPRDSSPVKTLTDMTVYTSIVEDLNKLFIDDEDSYDKPTDDVPVDTPPYTEQDFLHDVYMDESTYHDLVNLVRQKKNVILQGAPGVGKTYTAKRLAYSMMGEKDPNRVMMVQFHQSYSYEDFIMGFRPDETGFSLRHGVFYDFCKKAEDDPDNEYFFIIDEINRGNLSKIFGELFMLIENDKRGIELQLLYANERFKVPSNIFIIGMMNTADRSLAMMDYALRRRFSFFEMVPGFSTDGFRAYREKLENEKLNRLIDCVEKLNGVISLDESLGEGFQIGHSYFANLRKETLSDSMLMGIVKYDLVPLLKEYWFDEPLKVREWKARLESAVK